MYVDFAPFDQGITHLHAQGLELVTARELAEIHLMRSSCIYRFAPSWIAESFVYIPNGDILVAAREQNPLLHFSQDATRCHSLECEFYLSDTLFKSLFERAQSDVDQALTTGVLLLRKETLPEKISFEKFGEEPLTRFLFRDLAADYGHFRSTLSDKQYAPIRIFRPDSPIFPLFNLSPLPFARDIRIENSSILGRSDIDGIGYEGGGGMGGAYFQLAHKNYILSIRRMKTEERP